LQYKAIYIYNPIMQTDKTHNKVDSSKSWEKPIIEEIGDASDLIKEAKFSGFSDGVTFAGSPIGEST
jgi:hypothetical protein